MCLSGWEKISGEPHFHLCEYLSSYWSVLLLVLSALNRGFAFQPQLQLLIKHLFLYEYFPTWPYFRDYDF